MRIIMMSDGRYNRSVSSSTLDNLKHSGTKIYTIGLGSNSYNEELKSISNYTGGKFYKASTADEIESICKEICYDRGFDETDTDGDGLYDVVEKTGIRIQNGTIIRGCDPNKKDTDGDGLSDGEEIDPVPYSYTKEIRNLKTNEISHAKGYLFKARSIATKRDSDEDGLLDGERQYYKSRIIAPIDPDSFNYTGERGLWEKHTLLLNEKNTDMENNFATGYAMGQKYFDIVLKDGRLVCTNRDAEEVGLNRAGLGAFLSGVGSYTLGFTYDNRHIALHSDSKQWQINFGYNDFYDWVFHKATSMDKMKLDFELNGKPYVVWVWKGNYLNLGPGAELGVYTQNDFLKNLSKLTKKEHWIVGEERFPMTVSLYKKNFDSNKKIKGYSNYFNWMYGGKQWWATGFVPNIHDLNSVKKDELIQISSVDFTGNSEMFDALKNSKKAKDNAEYLIFDEEIERLWIMW